MLSPLLTLEVSISGTGFTLSKVLSKTGVFSKVDTLSVFSSSSIFFSLRTSVGIYELNGFSIFLRFCFSKAAWRVCYTTRSV
jgi:hypothetical protein